MPLPHAGFDAVVDSGLFHVFSDTDRDRYVAVLARVLRRVAIDSIEPATLAINPMGGATTAQAWLAAIRRR